jgi:hypothetical protein
MSNKNEKPPFCSKEDLERMVNLEHLTFKEIAKIYSVPAKMVTKWIRKYEIKRPEHLSNKDLRGTVFGRLTPIELDQERNDKNKYKKRKDCFWICRCICGNTTSVSIYSLLGGLTSSCRCSKKDLSYKGCGQLSGTYLHRIQKGAKKRGLVYNLTPEFLWDLFIKQNKICALSGRSINLVSDFTRQIKLHTASLDRIDNKIGYIESNVRWVHKDINMLRGARTDSKFVQLCMDVSVHNIGNTIEKDITYPVKENEERSIKILSKKLIKYEQQIELLKNQKENLIEILNQIKKLAEKV